MKIAITKRFDRLYRKLIIRRPKLHGLFEQAAVLLGENLRTPSLGVHKLSGKLEDRWAFSLTHDLRVIFKLKKDTIILTHIGTHDEVYRF